MSLVTTSAQPAARTERPGGLAEVLDVILDKGIVIDAYVRVTLVGIELLTIEARIVIASVDTYLRFAEATNRLQIGSAEPAPGIPGLMKGITEGAAKAKTKGALAGVKESVKETAADVVDIVRGGGERPNRATGGGSGTGRGVIASVKESVKESVKDRLKEAASGVVDKLRGDEEQGEPTQPQSETAAPDATGGADATGGTGEPAARSSGGAPRESAQRQTIGRGAPADRRPPRR